jgi:hypothetical protein
VHLFYVQILATLLKSVKSRHAPSYAATGSAKAVIHNHLKILDYRLRGNDVKGIFKTIYGTIEDGIALSLAPQK